MGPGATVAPSFKDTDATAIAQQIGGIQAVAPEARSSATVVAGGRNWSTSVIGSTNDWLITGNWKLGQGREFTDEELRAGAAVCIIGATLPRAVGNSADVIGQQLRVKGFPAA
jgi:putative ABC transport system permease protein